MERFTSRWPTNAMLSAEVTLALMLMSRPAAAVSEPLASETDIEAFWMMLEPRVTPLTLATVVEALLMSRPAVAAGTRGRCANQLLHIAPYEAIAAVEFPKLEVSFTRSCSQHYKLLRSALIFRIMLFQYRTASMCC